MKRYRLLAALALLLSCEPITVCACSPPGGGTAVITGTVLDPAENPVQGAAVWMRLMQDVSCEEVTPTITSSVASGAAGRFRHTTSWSGGRKCFRFWAEPPQGSTLAASEGQLIRIDFLDTVTPDSVEITLRLR